MAKTQRFQIRDLCGASNDSFQAWHCGWLVISVAPSCVKGKKITKRTTLALNTICICTTFTYVWKFTAIGHSRAILMREESVSENECCWLYGNLEIDGQNPIAV